MSQTETRGLARTILALVAAMLVGFVLFTSVPSGGIVNAQTSPTNSCGATIQWLNPSKTNLQGEVSDDDLAGQTGSGKFHLVAWVSNAPTGAVVDFKYKTTSNDVTIDDNVPKSGNDTYEFFWNIEDDTLDDSEVTLKAILSTGETECTRDEEVVTFNHLEGDAGPLDPAADTVEIKDPINNQAMGFYKNPAGTSVGVIKVNTSTGTSYVRVVYTVSTPGTEPTWKNCGNESNSAAADGIRCTLATGDDPNEVTAVGAVANSTPGQGGQSLPYDPTFDGSSDAHRVASYYQDPTTVTAVFLDAMGTNPTTPNAPNTPAGGCSPILRATVVDQLGRPVAALNVDFHAKGPSDDLAYALGRAADTFQKPDQGAHGSEVAKQCAGIDSTATQGDHEGPGDEDDTKHVESIPGTNNAGEFTIRVFHPSNASVPGETKITAFADIDGDDQFCESEPSDDAAVGFGAVSPASASGLPSDKSTCTRPNVSPSPSSAPPTSTPTSTQTSSTSTTTTTSTQPTTSPGGDRQVATKLSIDYDRPLFGGRARSSEPACRRGRMVVVKKKKPGKDSRVGTDKTARTGGWKLREPDAKGSYYAVVAKKVFTDAGGTTVICKRDKSDVVRERGRRGRRGPRGRRGAR